MTNSRFKILALTAMISIALTGCLNQDKQENAMSSLELPEALRGNSEVVAVVNGTKVYQIEFEDHVKTRTGQAFKDLAPEAKSQFFEEYLQLVTLSQKARKDGLDKDAETLLKIRNIEKNLLAQAVFTAEEKANPVTDAQIAAKYEAEKASFEQMSFKASHILLETEDAAKAVIAELKKGKKFADLAKEKSTGPTGPNGGDLGWFTADRMVAPFSAATAALEVGKFSETPVQTQFGYHVIFKEEEKKAEAPPLDSLRPRLEQDLKRVNIEAILEKAKNSATIEKLLVIEEKTPQVPEELKEIVTSDEKM